MGLFFDIETPADAKLLKDYDAAVSRFRTEVSQAMDEAADKEPSIAIPMRAAAEALRQRPLPSEVNDSEDALRRLTLSSITIEMAFAKFQSHADSEQALETAMSVAAKMREVGKTTTGAPQFRPLTAAVIQAVGGMKAELAKDMDGAVFDLHVAELKKLAAAAKAPSPPKPGFHP